MLLFNIILVILITVKQINARVCMSMYACDYFFGLVVVDRMSVVIVMKFLPCGCKSRTYALWKVSKFLTYDRRYFIFGLTKDVIVSCFCKEVIFEERPHS